MNCCDDYGNCRQGRDCPVRKEMATKQALGLGAAAFVVAVLFVCGLWWLSGVA
jgi:hypothetical protein